MNDEQDRFRPPDPRQQRLVALLYGELTDADAEATRREIDADPDLRRAWEEIRDAREALGELGVEAAGPAPAWSPLAEGSSLRSIGDSFQRRRQPGPQPSPQPGRQPGAHRRHRLRELALGSAWGVAAAAVLLLALGLARFRVERVENGLAFRVGATRATGGALPGAVAGHGAGAAEPAVTAAYGFPTPEPVYVTRDELSDYSAEIGRRLAVLLDDHARRRDTETAAWMQIAIEEMSRRQARDYGDLRYQIQQVGIGLARGQYRANEQIDWLLRLDRGEQGAPAVVPVNKEGDTP
jgi:hypothetical protein